MIPSKDSVDSLPTFKIPNHAARGCPDTADGPMHLERRSNGDVVDGSNPIPITETTYKIPNHADFLIVYSTAPGFYSWRSTMAGSWFIQALVYVLQTEGHSTDLVSILTKVSKKVALDFQSNVPGDLLMHEKKQIPYVTSMLTRTLIFKKKI